MVETRDREPNSDQASCSQGQGQPSPDHSANVHNHPRMMRGMRARLSQIKAQLLSDHTRGILAVEEGIASLHALGQEPFPGFTENMIAELASTREELGGLDPHQPSHAKRFVAVAKRIDLLSRTVSFVAERLVPTTESGAPATSSSGDVAKP